MKKLILMIMMLFSMSLCFGEITINDPEGNGIITITQTLEGEIGYALQNNTLSSSERQMITSATGFVLQGPFKNDPDLMQLSQKNSQIVLLDMSDCEISPDNLMVPAVWKNTLE